MCGRYCISASPGALSERYGISTPLEYHPGYNISPGTKILTVNAEKQERSAQMASWGFHSTRAHLLINARSETIRQKPIFRYLISDHRCLIPASGYYEWKNQGAGKYPWYISTVSGEIVSFAGVIRTTSFGSETVIITTEAYSSIAHIHKRMPVILSRQGEDDFLLNGTIIGLMADLLTSHPVSPNVNSPDIDDPALIEPWQEHTIQKTLASHNWQ
jgi:putative SOS response-associated peptidase YedK